MDVLVGDDGWLFLSGGTNSPFSYLTGDLTFSNDSAARWISLLRERRSRIGGRFAHLFVPNKETIYFTEAGLTQQQADRGPLQAFFLQLSPSDREVLGSAVVNPTTYMRRVAAEGYQLFWKTDTHWAPQGCFAAYQLMCSQLGITPVETLLSRPSSEGMVAMDLGSKLTPPIKEQVRFYNFVQTARRTYRNELVAFKEDNSRENDGGLHVGSNVIFRNDEAPNQMSAILFGDSFSEYRNVLLTGMLAETFTELHFVWSTSIDYSYIDAVRPDIVITEIVERFMPTVPTDTFALDSYVREALLRAAPKV